MPCNDLCVSVLETQKEGRKKKGMSASNILSVFNTLSEALQTESYRALPGGKPLTLALHCCDCGRWFDVALLTPFALHSLSD